MTVVGAGTVSGTWTMTVVGLGGATSTGEVAGCWTTTVSEVGSESRGVA